ncbi:MAG TPA: hypothetical protein VHT53_11390 [Candidatus Elarobacter sp.]|jgi:hypothetical protein|nr:hypothetical protein [Candidatus Elarobacter sp.]
MELAWHRDDLRQSALSRGYRPAFYRWHGTADENAVRLDAIVVLSEAAAMRSDAARPLILLEDVRKDTGELRWTVPPMRTGTGRYKVFEPGQLLYARMRPNLNKCIVIDDAVGPGFCSPEFLVLQPARGYDPYYVCALLLTRAVNAQLTAFVSGSSRPRLQWEQFAGVRVNLHPKTRRREIASSFRRFLAERARHRAAYESLEKQFLDSVDG